MVEPVSGLIRYPTEREVDPEYESIWEDMHDDEVEDAVVEMFERMGLPALDGKGGFVLVDSLGYVECVGEVGDDGKRYCTLALPVDGVLCLRPGEGVPEA